MRTFGLVAALGAAVALGSVAAHAQDAQQKPHGGTLKGAAIGAVAGHEMGGHTKTGAVVGAAVGHHEKAKSQQQSQ